MKYCNKCDKPVSADDKFCQHCGAPIENKAPLTKKTKPVVSEKITGGSILKWVLVTVVIGVVIGWVRYWIGYYVLIQGVIVGLLISGIVKSMAGQQTEALANVRSKMAIALFLFFMCAQAIGFGLAQPVFDPFNWLGRVWTGDTTESVFAIFSRAGVTHHTFSEGLSGGFWLLLSGIDLFFMFFFILITLPLPTSNRKS